MTWAEKHNELRGPRVKVLASNPQPEATYLTLSCGHTRPYNQIYHYAIGSEVRCFECGKVEVEQ